MRHLTKVFPFNNDHPTRPLQLQLLSLLFIIIPTTTILMPRFPSSTTHLTPPLKQTRTAQLLSYHHFRFMEEDELCKKRLKKLNLNAPILSTRRAGGSPSLKSFDADLKQCSSLRVPFSWEQFPGTPKGMASSVYRASEQFKPPRLPPCHWHSTKGVTHVGGGGGDNDDDNFTDAVDRFSLSDSLDVIDSTSNSRGEKRSPDFIIRRFLPDASALASSYVPDLPKHHQLRESTDRQLKMQYGPPAVEHVCSTPKACGIGFLFRPRRVKHTVCGVKDPVLHRRSNSENVKHKYNARQTQGASVEVFCKGGGRVHLQYENKS